MYPLAACMSIENCTHGYRHQHFPPVSGLYGPPRSIGIFGHNLNCLLMGETLPDQWQHCVPMAPRAAPWLLCTTPLCILCKRVPTLLMGRQQRLCGKRTLMWPCLVSAAWWTRWTSLPWSWTKPSGSSKHTFGSRGRLRRWSGSLRPSGWAVAGQGEGVRKRKVPSSRAESLSPLSYAGLGGPELT